MEPGMLTWQEVIVDHFSEQCMAKGVSGFIRRQYRSVNRLPEPALQLTIRGTRHGRQQLMINSSSCYSCQLQGLLRSVRKAQDTYVQCVAERVWHVDTAAGCLPGELFDE